MAKPRSAPRRRQQAATMQDVADLAGVSHKTVSNVISNYPHVSERMRSRVKAAIDKLGYQVNPIAQSLRSGRTGVIGLVVPDLTHPYFGELAQAVMWEARTLGLRVSVELTGGIREEELAALTNAGRNPIDGLLFSPIAITDEDIPLMLNSGPLVLLGESVFSEAVDHVTMSNVEGAYAATKHLLERGAHDIAVVGSNMGDGPSYWTLRMEGHVKALADAGIPLRTDLVLETDHWSRSTGAQAVLHALDKGTRIDGIFGLNDLLAIGALHALHLRGLRAPEEVQVIGFDNIAESAYTTPALTTIDPGVRRIAADALQLLQNQINGKRNEPSLVVEPYALVQRASTQKS